MKTGGGPPLKLALTELENRAIGVWGKIYIEGGTGLPSFGCRPIDENIENIAVTLPENHHIIEDIMDAEIVIETEEHRDSPTPVEPELPPKAPKKKRVAGLNEIGCELIGQLQSNSAPQLQLAAAVEKLAAIQEQMLEVQKEKLNFEIETFKYRNENFDYIKKYTD